MTLSSIDPVSLFKIRAAVARHGEMDRAKWWNSNTTLGSTGTLVFRRGFARTHHFAQARAVFAVARHRCDEHFNPPRSVTLWRLPQPIEERLDAAWETWLDDAPAWAGFFAALSEPQERDLSALLLRLEVVTPDDASAAASLRPSLEGRSVQLPHTFQETARDVALLALGFERGSSFAVPYARLAE